MPSKYHISVWRPTRRYTPIKIYNSVTFRPKTYNGTPGPKFTSIELARQWIRESWGDKEHVAIIWGDDHEVLQYHNSWKTVQLLQYGLLTTINPQKRHLSRWNPTNEPNAVRMPLNDFYVMLDMFYGAGLGAQLESLEMRLLTPDFKSPTHTTIKSFYDEPAVLPYDLLGDCILCRSLVELGRLKKGEFKRTLTIGPISAIRYPGPNTSLHLEWNGGYAYYDNFMSRMKIIYEIYTNGVILHITPYRSHNLQGYEYRYSTMVILNK